SSDLEEALRRSANYGAGGKPSGAWAKVLRSYLLWEAAERGSVDAVRSVAAGFWGRTNTQFAEHTQDLSDALLVRTANRLSGYVSAELLGWLSEVRTGNSSQSEWLLNRFSRVAAHPPVQDATAVAAAEASIQQLEHETQGDPEWVSQRQFINEEFAGPNTQRL